MIGFLDGLSDDSLKKEATSEARSETFSSIMKVHHLYTCTMYSSIHVYTLYMITLHFFNADYNIMINNVHTIQHVYCLCIHNEMQYTIPSTFFHCHSSQNHTH